MKSENSTILIKLPRKNCPESEWPCAIIDAADYEIIKPFKWHYRQDKYTAYAYAYDPILRCYIRMHREILDAEPAQEIDHVNGNGLDNRRSNLRFCTRAQNTRNRRKWGNSKFKGIQKLPNGRYSARIKIDGKQKHLGCFDTPEEAGRMYDAWAKELHGEFAYLNFPEAA